MIIYTATNKTDAFTAARVRSVGDRWVGVFRKGTAFNVCDVYPADKSTKKVPVFVDGVQRECTV